MAANRIAEARQTAGLTQGEVGDRVGAHWVTISKLERGCIKLTVDWMNRLAPVLGVRPADLMPAETAAPDYRFSFTITDQTTGDVIVADFCSFETVDEFGGCEAVDHQVARALRYFKRTGRAKHEAENHPGEKIT